MVIIIFLKSIYLDAAQRGAASEALWGAPPPDLYNEDTQAWTIVRAAGLDASLHPNYSLLEWTCSFCNRGRSRFTSQVAPLAHVNFPSDTLYSP